MSQTTVAARMILEALLAPHDAAWRESVVAQYRAQAERDLAWWQRYVRGEIAKEPGFRYASRSYVRYTGDIYDLTAYKPKSDPARYVVNAEAVRHNAEREFTSIREAFIARASEKIRIISDERDIEIQGKITFEDMIVGNLVISVGYIGIVNVRVWVKTNYRYGENSASGGITVYAQYPFDIVSAKKGDKTLTRPSVAEAAHFFGSTVAERQAKEKVDAIAQRQAIRFTKQRLETERDLLVQIEFALRSEEANVDGRSPYGKSEIARLTPRFEKHGFAIPTTSKEARERRKAIIAQKKEL